MTTDDRNQPRPNPIYSHSDETVSPHTKKHDHQYAQLLYIELFNLVQSTASAKVVDKIKIEQTIVKLIQLLQNDLYGELLLYTYTISKNNYVIAHITNVTILTTAFGVSLGLQNEDLMDLALCAFCHDFGMIDYTNLVQNDQELDNQARKEMENHPLKSAEKFRSVFNDRVIKGILDIHETISGQGYPGGKRDIEISFIAKLISICDIFEALTHPRQHRKEFNPYEALKMIIKKKDSVFEHKILKRFVEFLSIYPIGTLIHLNTGETAMIIGSNKGYPTRSIVKIFLNFKREILKPAKTVNLISDTMLYIAGCVDPKEEVEILKIIKPRGSFDL